MRFAATMRTGICVGLAILLTLALVPANAQAPSAALIAKSADAAAIAARASLGPLRIIVHHRASSGPGHRTLHTPSENLPAILSENRAAQESIVTAHFGPLAALTGRERALRLMGITPAFAINATAAEIEALANNPDVLNIAIDKVERPILIQSVPLIGMTNAYSNYNATGTGFAVAIIDSGVDKTHTFLANVILEACYSTTTGTLGSGGSASTCPGGVSSSTASGSGVNCNIAWSGCEHGTHVAGIAAGNNTQFQSGQPPNGVAKASGIIAIKAASEFTGSDCSPDPSPCIAFWDSDMQAALDHVYAVRNSLPAGYQGVASANLSIGGGSFSSNCNRTNVSFKFSIDNLLSANIATVIAAGNDGSTSQISFPACISSAIAVSASSKNDVIAAYTNINSQVAVFAPGGDFSQPVFGAANDIILSSVPAGLTNCNSIGYSFPGPNPTTGGSYCYLAGTSMATPHVAGAFAAIRSALPNATVAQILSALKSTGTPITDTRVGGTITKPRIRVDLALQSLANSFGTLQVSPTTNISSSGQQGGPFSPSSFNYTIAASIGTRNYAISGIPNWLTASSTSGTASTSGTTVTFNINSNANSLSPATYNATITFTDTTGNTTALTITATLTVNITQSVLQVSPATNIASSGNQGGSFSPPSFQYQLAASSGTIGYSISGLPAWLDVSSSSGNVTTSPATVTFTVNSTANGLAAGGYSATISFANTTNGQGNQTRAATLTVNSGGGGGSVLSKTYVSGRNGADTGVCPVTAPCASLNYALSVTDAGGQVIVLDGGVFGPIVITRAVVIDGSMSDATQIFADPTAQVGCIGAPPSGCGLTNNGYAVEIVAGVSDSVKISHVLMGAGPSGGAGALKFTTGGTVQLSENVYRGNDTAAGPIVALYPNNAGTTQAQVYFSHSDIGFNNGNNAGAGAIEVKPGGNTSLKVNFNHVEVHNASYGIRTDSSLLSGLSINVETAISQSEFFSFANAAVNVFSMAGTGATTAAFDAVKIYNANSAIKANGPQSVVILTNSTISGNGIGVQVQNSGTVYTPQNNTITGNGVDISGALTSTPPK